MGIRWLGLTLGLRDSGIEGLECNDGGFRELGNWINVRGRYFLSIGVNFFR
jgi:hypothetical protein